MSSLRLQLCAVLAALLAACVGPRPPRPVPPPPVGGDVQLRDISVEGPQGVSGELVRSYASSRFMLGHQFMDDEFWGPVDDQAVIGFETAFETEGDVVGGEVGFAVASPQGEENIVDPIQGAGEFEVELDYYELYSGLHRTFLRGTRIQPYVGAGLSIIWWDAEKRFNAPGQAEREDEDDNFAFGAYVHGGLSIQLTENLQVGLDLRALYGTDVEDLFGAGDLDYQRIALFIGFGD